MRLAFAIGFLALGLHACGEPGGCNDDTIGESVAPGALALVSPGRVYAIANWVSWTGNGCGRRAGAALYEVNLDSGAIEQVALNSWVAQGVLSDSEFVFASEGEMFAVPRGELANPQEFGAFDWIYEVRGVAGRAIVVARPNGIYSRGPGLGEESFVAIPEIPDMTAAMFSEIWTRTSAVGNSEVRRFEAQTLAMLGVANHCGSESGALAQVGGLGLLACDGGGYTVVSPTAGTVAQVSGESTYTEVAGDPTSPIALALAGGGGGIEPIAVGGTSEAFVIPSSEGIQGSPVYPSPDVAIVPTESGTFRVTFSTGSIQEFGPHTEGPTRIVSYPGVGVVLLKGDEQGSHPRIHLLHSAGADLIEPIDLPKPDDYFDDDYP